MMMISRLGARLAARASFTKPFEGYCFDYGNAKSAAKQLPLETVFRGLRNALV